MSPRIAAATLLVILAVPGLAASASAQPSAPDALLKGTFQMSGRVTVASNVRGERVGQVVTRTWTFTPECTSAPCATVQLVRGRANATDTLTLQRTRTGTYAGSGLFYAPLRCSARIYPQGQEIPFRISVRVTATTGTTASAISATYVNRERTNLTPCVGVLGHDSARYVGLLAPG
jgi:hypothetical protein